jgi:TrmH family RNA methyltransferase
MTRLPTSSATIDRGAQNVELVDSLLHPQAAAIRALLRRSGGTNDDGLILIDDEENILRAVGAGVVIRCVFVTSGEALSSRLSRALPSDVRRFELARRTCKKIFENDKVSRIFALADTPRARPLDTLLATRRDLVVLDGISIAGNIGAIIRTSLALQAGGIVLLDSEPNHVFDRRVIRASRGCLFALPVISATSEELVRLCDARGLPLVITAPGAGVQMSKLASLPHPLAIVYGGEKDGCSQALKDAAAFQVEIETNPAVQSLNVAAVAAITLYCRYAFNARPRC